MIVHTSLNVISVYQDCPYILSPWPLLQHFTFQMPLPADILAPDGTKTSADKRLYIKVIFITFFLATEKSLTHCRRVMHICVSEIIIIGSHNGLSTGQSQAIIWTNAGILLNGPLGINFSGILLRVNIFSFKKMHLNLSSAKCRLFSSRPQWVFTFYLIG